MEQSSKLGLGNHSFKVDNAGSNPVCSTITMTDMQNCAECGKEISWDEYVVNWTSCSDCFDSHVEKYFKDHPETDDPFAE